MSKFKDQTEDTPPSSSGESTEASAQPSLVSASTGPTKISTQTTKTPSPSTTPSEPSGLTTVSTTVPTTLTTPQISERVRQHAMLAKVALNILVNAGLIKRYEVRSPDSTTVTRVRYEFDMALWTEKIELK